jgi:hypothetical protein
MKDMNWDKGYEPVFRINGKTSAPRIGNVIHCEGGFVAESKAYDNDGKTITKFDNFQDGPDHMKNFIDSVRAGKIIKGQPAHHPRLPRCGAGPTRQHLLPPW